MSVFRIEIEMPSTTMAASVKSVIETTTQAELTTAFSAHDNHLAALTVWPKLISKHITHNNDEIIYHFGWIDYGFFVALLGLSTLIGVFYGFFSKHKQNNISEYVFGGRTMKMLPVATSMIASLV